VFYVMIVMLFFGAVFGMMSISQASNVAQNMMGMTAAAAAVVVSVLALFNTFGRIVAGYVSDRIGCINTLTAVFVIAIAALAMLYVSGGNGSIPLFYVGMCLIGVCFGAFMGIYPSFTASRFGSKNSSVNYGIMFIGFSAAGIIGPIIMSNVFRSTGSYRPAFLIAIVLAVIGLALTFLYRAMSGKEA
jgi:MFS family permease